MLLGGLPSHGSALAEAQRNSPEVVEHLLALAEEDGGPRWHPPGVEWTLHDELTASLFDRLGELLAVEAARGSRKKPRFPAPFPRPVRAVDLARSEADRAYFVELDDDVAAAQARWLAQQQDDQPEEGARSGQLRRRMG